MDDYLYLLTVFVVMGIISFGERALPFVASNWLRKQKWTQTLGDFLPLAIMMILVLHSALGLSTNRGSFEYFPEIFGIAITFVFQWFLKNSLLSIFLGTTLYVLLVNWLIG